MFTFLSRSHHCKALNSLICADVPLRNYSLSHSDFTIITTAYSVRFVTSYLS